MALRFVTFSDVAVRFVNETSIFMKFPTRFIVGAEL